MLPAYDAVKHHVGLNGLGLIVAGAYSKSFKRDQSDERSGVHYGSDSFFNSPGLSSWSMDDFTGGGWQQVWGKDARMFSSSQSMIPAQFDRSLRTVPPLRLRAATGVGGGIYALKPKAFFSHPGHVIGVWQDRIYKLAMNANTSPTADEIITTTGLEPWGVGCYDRKSGYVIMSYVQIGLPGVAPINPMTGLLHPGGGLSPGALSSMGAINGLDCDGDRLVASTGSVLWTVQMTPTAASLISSDWVRVGRLPANWIASTWMGQRLYVLCGGSDVNASLVAFDGVQVLPVAEFPYNFVPQSICSYAGRIYVGGSGRDISDGNQYAELYEVTGESLRLVKTFAPEYRSSRYVTSKEIRSMVVHEGLLFFGQTAGGLIAYDVTTDALYGAHRFDDITPSGLSVAALVSARERIWAYVPDTAFPASNAIWSGLVAGDPAPLNAWTAEVVTSEFAPELDRSKKWKRIRLLTRGESNAPTVSYSFDGGATWTPAPLTDSMPSGIGVLRTFDLADQISHSIRFRFTLNRPSAPTTGYTELVSFSTSFNLVDSDDIHEDGTEKLAWQFAVAGVETVELGDGSIDIQRLGELRDQLWAWAQNRDSLPFIDADGKSYTVVIDSFRESQPAILPTSEFQSNINIDDTDQGREAFYQITLVED